MARTPQIAPTRPERSGTSARAWLVSPGHNRRTVFFVRVVAATDGIGLPDVSCIIYDCNSLNPVCGAADLIRASVNSVRTAYTTIDRVHREYPIVREAILTCPVHPSLGNGRPWCCCSHKRRMSLASVSR